MDKYELLERVGEGGMAVVYRARHRTLGREVALKLLHPHLSRKERNRIRFEREAMAIESLDHEHIVRIFDYSGKESPECYIVMEFIRGATLKGSLEDDGKLPSEVAAMIGVHLCEALAYAHARGFIHRDIKPENVMIREDGVVKLMDFGIARMLDESSVTITGGLVGSPAYMSPEQASDGQVDARSDLFSLGTLLYRCVTGRLPFTGNSPPVILRNILEGQYLDPEDPEPGIAPELADVIRKALSVDVADRYQHADDMQGDLLRLLEMSEVDHSPREIHRYMVSPPEYRTWLEAHLGRVLANRGKQLLDEGNRVAALKLFNRALYLDDTNQVVLDLLQDLHKSGKPRTRHLVATLFVLLVPLGALFVIGPGRSQMLSLLGRTHGSESSQADMLPAPPPSGGTGPGKLAPDARDVLVQPTMAPAGVKASLADTPAVSGPRLEPREERENVVRATPWPEDRSRTPQNVTRLHRDRPAATGQKPRAETRRGTSLPVRPAVVNISSLPYAEVYINGKSYGNSMLRKGSITLPPGTYRLRLVNPYCEAFETEIVLKEGQIFDKHYRLTPLPARLTIRNLPANATVYLDGELQGTFGTLKQPLLIRQPRREHTLSARFPDGEERSWRIPKLTYNGAHVVDAGASGEGAP